MTQNTTDYITYHRTVYDPVAQCDDLIKIISRNDLGNISHPPKAAPYIPDDNDKYFMGHRKRGRALIINNIEFPLHRELKREGAEHDSKKMKDRLASPGFEVTLRVNIDCEQMLDICSAESEEQKHEDCDCFFMVVMTHGTDDLLMGTDGNFVRLDEMTDPFRTTKSLRGKPKMFLFSACRGQRMTSSVGSTLPTGAAVNNRQEPRRDRVPNDPDFLFMFATPASFAAIRAPESGTWLADAFDRAFSQERIHEKEILNILISLNSNLILNKEHRMERTEYLKQLCTWKK